MGRQARGRVGGWVGWWVGGWALQSDDASFDCSASDGSLRVAMQRRSLRAIFQPVTRPFRSVTCFGIASRVPSREVWISDDVFGSGVSRAPALGRRGAFSKAKHQRAGEAGAAAGWRVTPQPGQWLRRSHRP